MANKHRKRCSTLLQSSLTLYDPMGCIVCQAPLSMGFSRQEYWSGLPCLPPGDLPNPGIKPASLRSPALADGFFATSANWEAPHSLDKCNSKYSEYHITLARKAVVKKSTSNKCWSVWRK